MIPSFCPTKLLCLIILVTVLGDEPQVLLEAMVRLNGNLFVAGIQALNTNRTAVYLIYAKKSLSCLADRIDEAQILLVVSLLYIM